MRADARANRQAILDAAWRLFSDQGPDVSMRLIAQTAGVGAGTLYRHFPQREDLVVGLVEELWGRISQASQRAAAAWAADPARVWSDFVHELAALQVSALATQLPAPTQPFASAPSRIPEARRSAVASLEAVLALAKRDGLVPQDLTAIRFHLGLGAITRPLPAFASEQDPEVLRWLVSIYLRGLRPDA